MRNILFLLLLMLSCLTDVMSQADKPGLEITRREFQSKQVIPPSPEAAELGKYGNVPVSLFTGTPNISIPLVELKGSFLSLPVSLSHNHMGLKPDEIAPWTGLGWALNAGGVITRSVMGDPDVDANYYTTPSPLDPVPADEYQKQLYYEQIRLHLAEAQPDVYYYNFMGHSGKFVISPDNVIINKEKSYLKIVKDFAGAEADFIITDEQGMQFEFKAHERTLMSPTDDEVGAPSPIPRDYISAWYLTKVIAPNGIERIEFDYYSPSIPQSTQTPSQSPNSVTFTKTEYATLYNVAETYWSNLPLTSSTSNFHNPAISVYKKYIKKAVLIKNDIAVSYIDFESDINTRLDLGDADFDGERVLKKVKLYSTVNSVNTLVKEFMMEYAYFGIAQPEAPGFYRRLMLKTVREMSVNSGTTSDKPPYTFLYNGESATMPGRYPAGLDHWGYYNGQANSYGLGTTLIPTVYVPTLSWVSGLRGLGADREAQEEFSLLTVLARINYPTGGYTTFQYEGNKGSANDPVGGLRIREMIDHSAQDKPAIAKRYEYLKEDGSSSGQIAYYPNYAIPSTWENADNCPPNPSKPIVVVRTWNATISASSTFGLGTIQGSHIAYGRVTEYQVDVSTSNTLGNTVYTYDIQGFNEIDNPIGNGELLKRQVYDNSGKLLDELVNTYNYEDFDGEKLISRKLVGLTASTNATVLHSKTVGSTTTYRYYPPDLCSTKEAGYSPVYTVPSQYEHWHNEYLPQWKKLTLQTRKIYNSVDNNYISYTKNFTYGNVEHTYPTLIEEADSKADKVFTSLKYVADYAVSCSPSPEAGSAAAAIKEMQDKNMMGIPVETLQYREDAGGGNRRYINGEYLQHKSGLPEKIYHLQAYPMPTTLTTSTASCIAASQSIDSRYRLVATLKYDPFMNLREEGKTNDIVTTYFWGYNNRYPVAKVTGKTHAESLASGINQSVLDNPSSTAALNAELNKLRTLTGALVNSYVYNPLVGMTSATDERGRNSYYEYDALGRLTLIRDHDGNVVKKICYNYSGQPEDCGVITYSSAAASGNFSRNNCAAGATGGTVTYSVAAAAYTSTISQADANLKATNDVAANGQAYANAHSSCTWMNQEQTRYFTRNNCGSSQAGTQVLYTIPANTHSSTVSQADANLLAYNASATAGQAYANANGDCYCYCPAEGQRCVDDACETGIKVYTTSFYNSGNSTWTCYYHYEFSDGFWTADYTEQSGTPCYQP